MAAHQGLIKAEDVHVQFYIDTSIISTTSRLYIGLAVVWGPDLIAQGQNKES